MFENHWFNIICYFILSVIGFVICNINAYLSNLKEDEIWFYVWMITGCVIISSVFRL